MTKYITIPLSKTGKHAGKYSAIVDAIDEDLAELNWSAIVSPRNRTQYANRKNGNKNVGMHREIFERKIGRTLLSGEQVDHIDNNGLNNRRGNLRCATQSQNLANSHINSNSKSGFKGVCWHKKTGRWQASIKINGKQKHLGLFNTAEDAHEAYCAAADELFGEFANYG